MRHRLVTPLEQATLTYTRTSAFVSAHYTPGLNSDSDLDRFGRVVDWTITEALTATYDVKRVRLDPTPAPAVAGSIPCRRPSTCLFALRPRKPRTSIWVACALGLCQTRPDFARTAFLGDL